LTTDRPRIALLPQQGGIQFDEPTHRYWVWSARRERWLQPPSCSQVLGIAGAKGFDPQHWRNKLVNKEGLRPDEAEAYMDLHRNGRAEIGTELHALIRQELLSIAAPPVQFAESLLLLATWRRLFLPQIEEVIACESPLASLRYFYTGTPDLIAKVSGKWLIVDWKSKVSAEKAKPDQAWPLQLAGYDLLAEERYGICLDGAMNLMIWPGGCQEVFWPPEKMAELKRRYIGHVAWAHAVKGAQGVADAAGALEHLLQLHPDAMELATPPAGHGPWTVAQALGSGHPILRAS
jgi:hypothetical protein